MLIGWLLKGRKKAQYKVAVDVHSIGSSVEREIIIEVKYEDDFYEEIKDAIEARFKYLINYDIESVLEVK